MINYIASTTSQTLTFHECETVLFKDITTTVDRGTYVKLSNKEYIFDDYSRTTHLNTMTVPLYFGYRNNNPIINLEFSYDEV